ncbi:MAG: S1 RNA-binding domain-containing protein [Candidatus Margulisbacteria bacterium]|nr:S1 RNA-binding domain-containing protein [Candidatus Margulisiibacteriota bacterium]
MEPDKEPEKPVSLNPGDIVEGDVSNITSFGAFVKLQNGEEGLVHISEVANEYVTDITKYVSVGDRVKVKIMGRNKQGKLELSKKRTEDKQKKDPLFIQSRSKDEVFENKLNSFLKRSEEKQIDIRRNLKVKQGIANKKRKT